MTQARRAHFVALANAALATVAAFMELSLEQTVAVTALLNAALSAWVAFHQRPARTSPVPDDGTA